mmetsp:Transcript_31422/g.108657  ORF Transcript_31422/g.108657 Transcript_31422/m.108657 type:complete len:231 (+) Transcript_31422:183-875(+)
MPAPQAARRVRRAPRAAPRRCGGRAGRGRAGRRCGPRQRQSVGRHPPRFSCRRGPPARRCGAAEFGGAHAATPLVPGAEVCQQDGAPIRSITTHRRRARRRRAARRCGARRRGARGRRLADKVDLAERALAEHAQRFKVRRGDHDIGFLPKDRRRRRREGQQRAPRGRPEPPVDLPALPRRAARRAAAVAVHEPRAVVGGLAPPPRLVETDVHRAASRPERLLRRRRRSR